MDRQNCRGQDPTGRERWPYSPLPYQEEPKVLCPGGGSQKLAEASSPPSSLPASSHLGLLDPCGFREADTYGSYQHQFAVARMQLHPMLRS